MGAKIVEVEQSANIKTLDIATAVNCARVLYNRGQIKEAKELCEKILEVDPAEFETHICLADITLPGERYGDHLAHFHRWLKPEVYVEIGLETGKTLCMAEYSRVAIGIDPVPLIKVEFTTPTKIFPLRSDDFFEMFDLAEEMKQPTFEFAFLDGLHVFEQTLRDFMNVEKFSTPQTVVVIHDCLPLNKFTSAPERKSHFWSGDPWKIIPCLKKYRPDLEVFVIPAAPTGLGVVTKMDASSTVLEENWDDIMEEYRYMQYDYTLENRGPVFNVIENDWQIIKKTVSEARST